MNTQEIRNALAAMEKGRLVLHLRSREVVEAALRGRSLRALAREIDISPTYLSLARNGRTALSPQVCRALLSEIER